MENVLDVKTVNNASVLMDREKKKNRCEVYFISFSNLSCISFFFFMYSFSLEACTLVREAFRGREAHSLDMLQIMRRMPLETNGFSFARGGN